MAIEKILQNTSLEEFLDRYYLKVPYSEPGSGEAFKGLANWEVLDRILAGRDPDVMVVREEKRIEVEGVPDGEQAREFFSEGCTILVRSAEKHDRGLARLAKGFKKDFHAPVNVHLYFTPADHYGFGWHYDAEEVFLLQVHGSKEYSLRKNTVNPWPVVETIPRDMKYEQESSPVMTCHLEAGDWLYLPAGYWHKGVAATDSITLAVGVMAPSAIKIYDFLKQYLLKSLMWRQRLPVLGEREAAPAGEALLRFRALFSDLGDELNILLTDESVMREFLARGLGAEKSRATEKAIT